MEGTPQKDGEGKSQDNGRADRLQWKERRSDAPRREETSSEVCEALRLKSGRLGGCVRTSNNDDDNWKAR